MAARKRVSIMAGVKDRARLGASIEVGGAEVVGKMAGFDNETAAGPRAVDGDKTITDH